MNDMSDEASGFSADPAFPPETANEMLLVYKKQFIKFWLFIAFLIVLFAIPAAFSALSYHSTQNGLKDSLVTALKEHGYEDLTILDSYEIQNPFTVGVAAYSVADSPYSYAVIIKLTTMVGPVPAVFLYDTASPKADFVCFLSLGKRVERFLTDNTGLSLIEYWARRLPQILSAADREVQQL